MNKGILIGSLILSTVLFVFLTFLLIVLIKEAKNDKADKRKSDAQAQELGNNEGDGRKQAGNTVSNKGSGTAALFHQHSPNVNANQNSTRQNRSVSSPGDGGYSPANTSSNAEQGANTPPANSMPRADPSGSPGSHATNNSAVPPNSSSSSWTWGGVLSNLVSYPVSLFSYITGTIRRRLTGSDST
ncbi:hypothetical protein VCUG_02269 [Vavraia culicis subsp. floridensis]|uniref:Uncharacterized protein n=1 Tax=Vavraia culicis (isolate floridensis) TaxID=948595 RepID=L2GT30_VAVCU|nr:uncharacterized protein VCUG_02269 [Vavraia culicis subsp. floridensis]ELA46260.1 hypothetical protein VCUG_02269 [Vavraia culicis subsp. floridensis]